jgi:hypothetical protein
MPLVRVDSEELEVVDEEEERRTGLGVGERAEEGCPHRQRCRAGTGRRTPTEMAEQLVDDSVRQVLLRLLASCLEQGEVGCFRHRGSGQRGLADARLAADEHDPCLTAARTAELLAQERELPIPADQPRPVHAPSS